MQYSDAGLTVRAALPLRGFVGTAVVKHPAHASPAQRAAGIRARAKQALAFPFPGILWEHWPL